MTPLLDKLPTEIARELAREHYLDTKQAAEVLGLSIPHLRRLVRRKQAPQPIRLGERKLGFRLGDCLDHLQAKREVA